MATHVIMSDDELVEKLVALVPEPRFHLVRYFGILASAAKQRPSIVPVHLQRLTRNPADIETAPKKKSRMRAITAGPN